MKFTKKLNRFGSDSYGLVFTKDVMAQLGGTLEEAKSEAGFNLMFKFYDDTLIVRRADAPPLTPAEVAYFLTGDLEFAQHFLSSPIIPDDDETLRPSIEDFMKPGLELKLTRMMRHGLMLFKTFGPLTRDDLIERFGVAPAQATRIVSAGFENNLLIRHGDKYHLNQSIFDV